MALDLMGRVIEVVSGQPFDRFLQERFFDPLGMADTHFQVPRAKAERMTTSYFLANGTLLPIDLGAELDLLRRAAAAVRRRGPRQHAARLRPVPARCCSATASSTASG